jgi:two-component system response regulator NreC
MKSQLIGRGAGKVGDDEGVGIRVLCVDDHALLVEGLRAQFGVNGRVRIVGVLGTADHLVDEVARLRPDIVLLDVQMPGADVFEMADRLHHQHPGVRFVFLSAHVRDGYLAAAYKCGAWGFFSKSDSPEDILAGVHEVAASSTGTFVMGPTVRRHTLMGSPGAEASGPATALGSLSAREVEVLRLIGKGLSRGEIAEELCRSAKTIDGHQERILKKLNMTSRSELMRFAIREGLAEA